MYQNILVAVDGSPTSNLALLEAARLAPTDASVRVVTVVENPVWSLPLEHGMVYDVELMHASLIKAGRDVLERARLLLKHRGLEACTQLLDLFEMNTGIAGAILAEAEAWPADVIVLGTHGRRGVRRLLMGSVAEQVVRASHRPVLLVRASGDSEETAQE